MNFYLFRHGITYASKNGLEYGKSEETAGILKEAFPSLKRLGQYLKTIPTDANLTSPYKRCLETVDIVSRFSEKEFGIDERLGECRLDLESMENFFDRIKEFMESLKKAKYENVLLCSHGYPLEAIIQYISDGKFDGEKLDPFPDTGVLTIYENGKFSLKDFNGEEKP